jgi:hypothetical protein
VPDANCAVVYGLFMEPGQTDESFVFFIITTCGHDRNGGWPLVGMNVQLFGLPAMGGWPESTTSEYLGGGSTDLYMDWLEGK